MANDSSTGGFLSPLTGPNDPVVIDDEELWNFFQEWFVGLTGIDPTLVRPRWQQEAPNVPPANVNWLSFGITKRIQDQFPAELHSTEAASYNELRRHEEIDILVSAYGPKSSNLVSILTDGMQISQNREILSANSMGLIETGDLQAIPELLKGIWYRRIDVIVRIRRQKRRHYGVLNLLEAEGILHTDDHTESIIARSPS